MEWQESYAAWHWWHREPTYIVDVTVSSSGITHFTIESGDEADNLAAIVPAQVLVLWGYKSCTNVHSWFICVKTLTIDFVEKRREIFILYVHSWVVLGVFRTPLHSTSSVWRSRLADHGGGYPLRLMASRGGLKSLFCCFCGSKRRFQKLQVWEYFFFTYVWLICSKAAKSYLSCFLFFNDGSNWPKIMPVWSTCVKVDKFVVIMWRSKMEEI